MKTKTKITMLLGLLLALAGFVIALLFGWEWPDPYGGAELGVWYAGDIAHIAVDSGSAEVRVYDTDGSRIEVTADGWADSFSAFAADGQLYVTYDGRGGLFRPPAECPVAYGQRGAFPVSLLLRKPCRRTLLRGVSQPLFPHRKKGQRFFPRLG